METKLNQVFRLGLHQGCPKDQFLNSGNAVAAGESAAHTQNQRPNPAKNGQKWPTGLLN